MNIWGWVGLAVILLGFGGFKLYQYFKGVRVLADELKIALAYEKEVDRVIATAKGVIDCNASYTDMLEARKFVRNMYHRGLDIEIETTDPSIAEGLNEISERLFQLDLLLCLEIDDRFE